MNFSGLVDLDKVFLYTAYREKYIAKGRGSDFFNAVKSLEDYMSDRMVNVLNENPSLIDFISIKFAYILLQIMILDVSNKCTSNFD